MVSSTTGILLKNIKHSDSSAIIQVFTKEFGRKSYFIRGLSKKKNSPRSKLFPMSILELQVTDRENKSIQQIRDLNLHKPTFQLVSNPIKASIALFLNEVLSKSIEQDYRNPLLYDFLENAIQVLDLTTNPSNFHLWFLLELSRHFGFYPLKDNSFNSSKIFNLESGLFTSEVLHENLCLLNHEAHILNDILGMNFDELSSYKLDSSVRKVLLKGLVSYFIIHVPNLKYVSSLDVLETVFDF